MHRLYTAGRDVKWCHQYENHYENQYGGSSHVKYLLRDRK